MKRFGSRMLCVCLAAAFCMAVASWVRAAASEGAAEPEPAEEQEGEPGGIAAMAGQVQTMAYAMQQEAKEKRLAVLKRLEAGEITAEAALDELDKLPASPAQFATPGKASAWLAVSINQGAQQVDGRLPLTVVQWLISEGPKMLPTEAAEELKAEGIDLEALNLMGLAMAVDALGQVENVTRLLHIKQGAQEIEITIEPPGSTGRPARGGGTVLEE